MRAKLKGETLMLEHWQLLFSFITIRCAVFEALEVPYMMDLDVPSAARYIIVPVWFHLFLMNPRSFGIWPFSLMLRTILEVPKRDEGLSQFLYSGGLFRVLERALDKLDGILESLDKVALVCIFLTLDNNAVSWPNENLLTLSYSCSQVNWASWSLLLLQPWHYRQSTFSIRSSLLSMRSSLPQNTLKCSNSPSTYAKISPVAPSITVAACSFVKKKSSYLAASARKLFPSYDILEDEKKAIIEMGISVKHSNLFLHLHERCSFWYSTSHSVVIPSWGLPQAIYVEVQGFSWQWLIGEWSSVQSLSGNSCKEPRWSRNSNLLLMELCML